MEHVVSTWGFLWLDGEEGWLKPALARRMRKIRLLRAALTSSECSAALWTPANMHTSARTPPPLSPEATGSSGIVPDSEVLWDIDRTASCSCGLVCDTCT